MNSGVWLAGELVQTQEELTWLYQRRIAEFGYCSTMMFYASEAQHQAKLQALLVSVVRCSAEQAGFSVLEVGCGFGSFASLLPDTWAYTGADLVPEFISRARELLPTRTFLLADALSDPIPSAQCLVLAGVLSSTPSPLSLLRRVSQFAEGFVVFDFTLEERLPATYRDLARVSPDDVAATLSAAGFTDFQIDDYGSSWVVLTAARDRVAAPSR